MADMFSQPTKVFWSEYFENLLIYHEPTIWMMGAIEGENGRKLMIGNINAEHVKFLGLVYVGEL